MNTDARLFFVMLCVNSPLVRISGINETASIQMGRTASSSLIFTLRAADFKE
jgi:hypothetical protein